MRLKASAPETFTPPGSPARRYASLRLVNAFVLVIDVSQLESSFAYAARMREQILRVKGVVDPRGSGGSASSSTFFLVAANKQDLWLDDSDDIRLLKEYMSIVRKQWK